MFRTLTLCAALLMSGSANAALLTFDLVWESADGVESVGATCTITIDDSILPHAGFGDGAAALGIVPVTVNEDNIMETVLLAQQAEEQGIVVDPGHLFGYPSSGWLVVSLLTPPEDFDVGITGLKEAIQGMSKD